MQLVVLGSGSKGNSFALVSGDAVLLIDAGFSAREIERRLGLAGIDPARIVAIALTHEHGDHAAGAVLLCARYDVPLLSSLGTWQAIMATGESCDFLPIGTGRRETVGPFTVSACPTSHDAAEPIAIGVTTDTGFSIGAAYDLGRPTQAVRWFLRERHCLILESNHDETLLRTSGYPISVQQRIAGPGGHLSNHDAARLLEELYHDALATVVLAHLSQRCNRRDVAHETVSNALRDKGFVGELFLADQDGPMATITLRGPMQRSLFV
ncbi:MAG TPA: MBL fold metallo-hydrolase [Gemmatimonadales bacterium]|jgi:phosphoribosyl 1,2-cyclic phosphodiesterase